MTDFFIKMNEFEKLSLNGKLVENLRRAGLDRPLEIQEKVIPIALTGRDIIGKSETGSGKTLAFALPILNNLKSSGKVSVLVLTPTRELAEQVSDTFVRFSEGLDLETTSVYGGVSINNQIKKIPYSDIVVGTPGRIIDHLQRNTLNLRDVRYLVLDEVDRMFDMGFYPDVEKILSSCPKGRQTFLFSATISQDIDYLAKKHTKDAVTVTAGTYVDPTKLQQIFYDTPGNLKFSLLVHLLKKEKTGLVMVFTNTKRTADLLARWLRKVGIDASAIHGDLSQNRRQRTLEEFHKSRINVLVCTDVAARGLDIKGVSHVYNYDLPSKADDYIHRVGRTARAKKEGIAINILASRDYENFDRILKSNPSLNIERKEMPKIEIIKMESERGRDEDRGRRDFRGGRSNRGFGGAGRPNRGHRGVRKGERKDSFGDRGLHRNKERSRRY
jgi:ATP-dependent RNA helicase DeaD